jgi:hypothetical protein
MGKRAERRRSIVRSYTDAIKERNQTAVWNETSIDAELEEENLQRKDVHTRLQEVRDDCADTLAKLAQADYFWRLGSSTQEDFLIRCLRTHQFDVATAVKVVTNLFDFRTEHYWPYHVRLHDDNFGRWKAFRAEQIGPDSPKTTSKLKKLFERRSSNSSPATTGVTGDQLRDALASGVHWILPKRDKFDRVVIVLRPHKLNFRLLPLEAYQLMGSFCTQWSTGITTSPGVDNIPSADLYVSMVIDLSYMGIGNLTGFGLTDIERGIRMWQGTFPLKLRAIYFINSGTILNGVINIATSFLTQKMKDRIVTFDIFGEESKRDFFDRLGGDLDAIPRSWGGNLDYEDVEVGKSPATGSQSPNGNSKDAEVISGWRKVVEEAIAAAELARDENGDGDISWWQDWVPSKCDSDVSVKSC